MIAALSRVKFAYHALTMPSERVQRRIDAFLDQADEALHEGDWGRAMGLIRAVLDADPDNADAGGGAGSDWATT